MSCVCSKAPNRGLWMRRAGSLWHKSAGASNTLKLSTNESWVSLELDQWEWRTLSWTVCSTIWPTVCNQQSAVKSARLGHWHCQLPEGIYTKYKDIYVKNIIVGSNLFFCVFYKIPGRKWKMMIKSPESIHQHIICWDNYGWRLVLTYNLG